MLLSFRQGIARYQTDTLATATFLQRSAGAGNFIDLIVAPDPTIIVFAHKTANYVVEELRTVTQAWGPISGSGTLYLYWDVNLLTGELTRGITGLPPIISAVPPATPANDQHWFDTDKTTMRVWSGKWVDKVRVFAGYLTSGSIIRPYSLGSQVGIAGEFEGGSIVLDAYNKPLRQSDGTFVTSTTSLVIVNGGANRVKFETEIMGGMAVEPLPKFSLVQVRPGRRLVLARHTDYMSRIAGIVTEDVWTNEVAYVITDGLIRNEQWSWPANKIGRPIFCGPHGQITTTPPTSGVLQIAGFVHDVDTIYLNVYQPIILDDIFVAPPPPPPPGPLVADFSAFPLSGAAPLTVNFTSLTTGTPSALEWDFVNDGNPDAATPTATYTYATPGTYTVRLRAYDGVTIDEEIKTNFITVSESINTALNTNLDIRLTGPSQAQRNTQLQIGLTISNDGFLTATNVTRTITIPDISNQRIQVSNLPPGAVVTRSFNRTIVEFPVVPMISTGLTYGPIFFTITTPAIAGTILIEGVVNSPELDAMLGDNTVSLSIEVI
jgi:PKD repeat protein